MKDSSIEASKLAAFSETIDELLENKHKTLVFSRHDRLHSEEKQIPRSVLLHRVKRNHEGNDQRQSE